jgi:hypothetical protein
MIPKSGNRFSEKIMRQQNVSRHDPARDQCDAKPSGPPSGRTSAAIKPFGPGPKRTSTV